MRALPRLLAIATAIAAGMPAVDARAQAAAGAARRPTADKPAAAAPPRAGERASPPEKPAGPGAEEGLDGRLAKVQARLDDVVARLLKTRRGQLEVDEQILQQGAGRATADVSPTVPAAAAPTAAPIPPRAAERAVAAAELQLQELEDHLATAQRGPGTAAETSLARAQRRYREGMERFRAGDWLGAAAHLQDAVETRDFKGTPEHVPAIVALGDALRRLGACGNAIAAYRLVLSQPASPAAEVALGRAADCMLVLGRHRDGMDLVRQVERAWGSGDVPPEVLYLAAKGAFRRTDKPPAARDKEALEALGAVPRPYHVAAGYLRGVVHLRAGDRDRALAEFEACSRLPAPEARQREQRELCTLAAGRLQGGKGNWTEMYHWYEQIPHDSARHGEAIYEQAKTLERGGLHEDAARVLDTLPSVDPESRLAADVELLRARLLSRGGRHADAAAAYSRVRQRLAPTLDRLDAVLSSDRDPSRWLERLAPGYSPAPGAYGDVPPVAVGWARSEIDPGRGRDLLAGLEAASVALGDARSSAARLDALLARDGGMAALPQMEAARIQARELVAAAGRIEGRLAADPSPDAVALRGRARDLQGRAEREERSLAERARVESDRLRTPIAEDQKQLAAAGGELEQMRRDATEALGREANRAFQVARTQVQGLVTRADRGLVEDALASHAGAKGQIRALIVRRAFEDRLSVTGERRATTAATLDSRARALESQERTARQAAIAQLDDFVKRHPDDPAFTPLALSRLGELRYERAEDEPAVEATAGRTAARASGATAAEPRGCAAALGTYRQLAEGFPAFENKDRVSFLIGYCLGEMGRTSEAIQVFSGLIQKFPDSPHVTEAWIRLGDLYFEEGSPESLQKAVAAYSRLYASPEHALYVHAVYMLGWVWYRMDELPRAIEAFTKLLDHLGETAQKTGLAARSDLWGDAVKYTAASFAHPRWDGVRMAREWFGKRGRRPYEFAVYQRLGDALLDQARYPAAVEAYELAIARAPLAGEAPLLQSKIVRAWNQERRPDQAAAAREVLLATYAEGGDWWRKHEGAPELLKEVRALREGKLAEAAAYNHARAQELAKAGQVAAAAAAYERAERAYANHLQSTPEEANAYDLTFAWADAAYGAGQYEKAARLYEQVRDDPSRTSHQGEAALEAVRSWEAEVNRLQKAGQITERKLLLAKDRAGETPPPESLPPALAALVRASDAFVERSPRHERAPVVAYGAGEIAYRYNQWEDARRRLESVVARWPRSEVAAYAANLAVETHLASKDWAAVEGTSGRLKAQVAAQNATLAASLGDFELAGRFQRALGLMDARRWAEAAPLFVAVADAAPRHEFADKALHNAARCLDESGRPDEALRLHARIVEGHPASPFADGSLFRLAVHADETWDPERAAERYEQLLRQYPQSKHRKDAQYNLARALDHQERLAEAARAWMRWSEAHPDDPFAARALFRAAMLLEKAKDWAKAAQAWRDLQRRFGKSGDPEILVQSQLRLALVERQLGNETAARTALAAAVAEFDRRGLDPAKDVAAGAAAAESRFLLAEVDLERFDRIQLPATTNAGRLKKALDEKLAEMRKVAPQYQEVKRYLRPDWTLAAFYRQAYLLERLAQTLYEAPVPPEFKRAGQEEYLAAYQDQLSAYAKPFEDEAVQVYEQAAAAARDLHVRNEWTRKTEAALARHRPKEHRLVRETRGRWIDDAPAPGAAGAAEAEARKVLAADPRNVPALVRLAAALQARGRVELARTVLDQARQLDAGNPAVWIRLGFVEQALGARAVALESWRKAAELGPGNAAAQANLGQALLEAGDAAGAAQALERAVQAAPGSAPSWLDLGNARARAGRFEDAQRAYEKALALDPMLADAWLDLGLLHLDGESPGLPAVARLEKALVCFDRFAAAGGEDPALPALRAEAQASIERERRKLARDAKEAARTSEASPAAAGSAAGAPATPRPEDEGAAPVPAAPAPAAPVAPPTGTPTTSGPGATSGEKVPGPATGGER